MNEENNVSVNFEMETRKTKTNPQLLTKLNELITARKDEDDSDGHFNKIRDFLLENTPYIYGISENGRNCFHLIAREPLRDPRILALFGLGDGSLRQYLTETELNELMIMKDGPRKRTPIHRAMEYGFWEFANQMLTFCPSLLTIQDGEGNTPLHVATMCSSPEASDCVRNLLTQAVKDNLIEELIMNHSRNNSGKTPIHTLCTNVPINRDSPVIKILELFLQFPCAKDALSITDTSGKTPLHLLCSRADQIENDSKNPNLVELVRILISNHEDHLNEQTQDEDRRTALHLACISEFPKIVEILAQHPETNVTIHDAHSRMAIHYAAENSLKPRGYQCVKILSDWSQLKRKMRTSHLEAEDHFKQYLLWNRDCIAGSRNKDTQKKPSGNTVLTLACEAKSTKTANVILRNLFEAKPNFDIWFIGKDLLPNIYSLKQVYKNAPEALEFLFDRSIRIDLEKSDERRVEFTTNISIITALARPILGDQSISEMQYLSYAKRWSEDTREKLLLHPLTQCVLFATWRRMFYYNILWFLVSMSWLIAYSILVPYKYSHKDGRYPTRQIVAAWILAIFNSLYAVNEILEMKLSGLRNYFKELLTRVNIRHWLQIMLTLFVIYNPICGQNPPSMLEKYCAAAGVAISYILFWSNIGVIYLPLGIHVEYLIQTLKKIIMAVLCCIPIIIGFEIAFQQILEKHFNNTSIWAFTKVLVMMTGEFEYTSIFEEDDKDNNSTSSSAQISENGTANNYGHTTLFSLIAFIVFLIIVPVAFYNLATGLVVDKVKSLQSRIEMQQAYNHIRLINYLQRTISKFDGITSCFLSYQHDENGEISFDQQKRWYIEKNAYISWMNRVRNLSLCSCHFGADGSIISPICGNLLPDNVKQKIFQLYENQIAKDTEKEACPCQCQLKQ
ncbi:unnamed protein product [Orchesella dallaii]|uniref:Ion transport domain-containing protein n=1 Tax=Orchesella dallaii TaxID=48710 RepID=A0ABP1QNJ1_9HEXA